MKFRVIKRIIMRSRLFMCLLLILFFSFLYLYYHREALSEMEELHIKSRFNRRAMIENSFPEIGPIYQTKLSHLIYVLLWTSPRNVPFVYFEEGQTRFMLNHCRHFNCYVSSDRSYFADITEFDVIVFSGPEVVDPQAVLPNKRSVYQKYVFASVESSHTYPTCSNKFDGYFNLTWTYRLDSDSRWGYIVVRDMEDNIIGPNKVMHWMNVKDMKPLNEEFKESLLTKTRAAAWFVSNCESLNKREAFVNSLEVELEKFGLSIDKYGECGVLICSKEDQKWCNQKIKRTYYFYLAFENAFDEDYVTEKLMLALTNNAIPVVYGGANYTRFMPDGMYLNARELGPKKLAKTMNELINSPTKYASYFKWKNHYKYHATSESAETDNYCNMCMLLNYKPIMQSETVYKNFQQWWDSSKIC